MATEGRIGVAEAIHRGEEAIARGRNREAVLFFEDALASDPDNIAAITAVAGLAHRLGEYERCLHHIRRAIARKRNVAEYHLQMANALIELGRLDEAVEALGRALKLKPQSGEALCSLGCVLTRQGRPQAAMRHLERALKLKPGFAPAQLNLGSALFLQGRITDAIAALRKAVEFDPKLPDPYISLVKCLNYLPGGKFALVAEASRRWAQLVERLPVARPHGNVPDPDRRLRVGYISGDFRHHPVTHFLESVLAAHDRTGVEIACYSNNPVDDPTTERIRALADLWRPVTGLANTAVEEMIRQDRIDLLVDLSGHTSFGRPELLARKPAPVQCTWLGYYATTGLSEIDYIICDRYVVPAGEERFYTERPWRMPDSYLCFTPPDLDVPLGPPPSAASGAVTFGSCNNPLKINQSVLALWQRILLAVPGSRLVLRGLAFSNPLAVDEMRRRLLDIGLPEERWTLLPGTDRRGTLETYSGFDIALDTFPYGGGTTTVEALWMGVPVVSLRGDRFSGRVSESVLATIGLPELVVESEEQYVAKAAALAADAAALAQLRARLRPMLLASPLCDAPRFARHLEAGFRQMWQGWCRRQEKAA